MTEQRDVHRIPIVVALVVLLWIGMSASRFSFWDYKYECTLWDLCDYADVIRGRQEHWAYFTLAAVLLAVGVALHLWRGRTNPARSRPASVLLLLSPGLLWVLYLPVGFATMFYGDHLMAAAALTLLVGAVWLASESMGRVRGARLDLAVCYTAVGLGAAATGLVWRFWPQRAAGLDAWQAALLLGAGVVTVTLLAYKGLSWPSVPLRNRAKGLRGAQRNESYFDTAVGPDSPAAAPIRGDVRAVPRRTGSRPQLVSQPASHGSSLR